MRRGFPLLVSATAFAVVADAVLLLTLAWELAATGRRGLLGLLLAISAATRLLLMPLGGALADRHDKVGLLRLSAVIRVLALALLAWGVSQHGTILPVAAMLLLGAATAVHYPADRAVVVELVPEESLDRANGILQTLMNTGNIAGPALAATSIGWIGASPTLLVAAAGYLCGALILLLIPGRRRDAPAERTAENGLLASMVEGFRFAWKDRSLLTLLLVVGAVNLGFLGAFSVAVPAHVVDALGGRPGTLAAIEAAFAGGSILGAALIAWWKNLGWPVIPVSLAVIAAAMAALALTHSPVLGTVVMLLGGIGSGMTNVVPVTAIQRRTPREQMGRIMGTVTLMAMGLGPVSLALAGALIGVVPAFWIILGGAALILVTVPCVIGPARAVAAARQDADDAGTEADETAAEATASDAGDGGASRGRFR